MVYSPATRLLTALDLLQSRPRVSAAQLARRLEVNTRSVRRYVLMLQDMGIPVEAIRGRYGGYRLRPGFKLPPLMLTEDEALAVTLGLLAAQRLGLDGETTAVDGALTKVERVLPMGLRERVQAVQESVELDLEARESAGVTGATGARVLALSAAAHHGRRVRIRYRSARENGWEETERLFDPYGLVFHDVRWYAVGYCHLRDDVRVFRLDRVLAIAPVEDTFVRPEAFDCLDFAMRRFAAMPERWLVEAVLDTTLERMSKLVPPSFATLEEVPEGVLLRAYDASLDHAARFLVGLGCPFSVRQPPELQEALGRLANWIAQVAGQHAAPG